MYLCICICACVHACVCVCVYIRRHVPGTQTVSNVHRCLAEAACSEYKVASQNDRTALALAKDKAYKLAFYDGTMLVGAEAGSTVQEAKARIRDYLVAQGPSRANA